MGAQGDVSFYSFIPHLCVGVGEREYYEKQLATLRTFEEVEALCMPGEFESDESDYGAFEDKEQKQSEFAMKISNYANIVLLVFKVISFFFEQYFKVTSRVRLCNSTTVEHGYGSESKTVC